MFGTRPAYTAYTCSNKADRRLETNRIERRQSSTGQVDRKESGTDQGESRLSSTDKVERRKETAVLIGWRGEMRQSGLEDMVEETQPCTDQMERRQSITDQVDRTQSCRHLGGDTDLY
jgi:hypothetical protein